MTGVKCTDRISLPVNKWPKSFVTICPTNKIQILLLRLQVNREKEITKTVFSDTLIKKLMHKTTRN